MVKLISFEIPRCKHCGRQLKDDHSIACGLGPVCRRRDRKQYKLFPEVYTPTIVVKA
jgi:hypothetical protein